MADMWTEAGKEAAAGPAGMRYNWVPLPKPWHWIFTFWKGKWKNWGKFQTLKPGDVGYGDASYECTVIPSSISETLYEHR